MAYFSVHIMNFADASKQTILLPAPSAGFEESIHEEIFFGSQIPFEQTPQLKKLRVACWAILEKYFGQDLDDLIGEIRVVLPLFKSNERIHKSLNEFESICREAQREEKGIVCTGD